MSKLISYIKLLNPPVQGSCLDFLLFSYKIANIQAAKSISGPQIFSIKMPQDNKTTRSSISNHQKATLRAQHFLKPYLSYTALQNWFQESYNQRITPSSISRILSSRYEYLDTIQSHLLEDKRRRTEQWPELDNAVLEWIQRAQSQITISQEVIREKARQYWPIIYPEKEMPTFSNGWLRGFQARHNIKQNTQHGEAGSLSEDAAAEMIRIRQLLSSYAPQDIYNCDETALYWRMIPDRSLSSSSIPGRRKNKARITAHFCCNSDASERLPIWFIGTAKKPKAFTAAGINIENLDCVWRSNKKAWMTGDIFKEWLLWFNKRMTGRKVILLMDNFSAHEAAFEAIHLQLQNTLVIWLPCNSTTRYQPLDQGIIRTWKAYWKRQWVLYMMTQYDHGYDPISTMTILFAIRWAISAWTLDLSTDTIRNCFHKALSIEDVAEIHNHELLTEISQGLQKLELSNNIHQSMEINQFLNPLDERVDDDLMTVDDIVLSQYAPSNIEDEEDDDNWEPLPQITAADALESLYKLRLYEEQQVDADKGLIQQLLCHERVLLQRKAQKQRQCDIRGFFN